MNVLQLCVLNQHFQLNSRNEKKKKQQQQKNAIQNKLAIAMFYKYAI